MFIRSIKITIRSNTDGTNHTAGCSSQFSFASQLQNFHTSVISDLASIIVLWSTATLNRVLGR